MSDRSEPTVPRSLSLAMIVQFAVGGAVVPFISIILRDRGLNFKEIGTVFFVSSSTLLVFPFLWGMLADRFLPLNRVFTLLNILAIGALLGFAMQRTFWGLLLTFTCFYATFNPTLTLINALSFRHLTDPRRQFGAVRSWGSLGWILPSLPIFLWLARSKAISGTQTANLDFVLYFGIGLSAVMIGLSFFLPHTPPGAGRVQSDSNRMPYWPAMKQLLSDPNYLTILGSFFLVSASFSIYIFYSPPFLEDHGVNRAWIGPIQCLGAALEVVLFRWQPGFVRRWSYHASILIGCLCLLLRQLVFASTDQVWLLCTSYLLPGLVIVFYHIGISVLVNALARPEVRATAQTMLVFLGSGLGPMVANWIAGRLATAGPGGLRPVFIFAAALAALASLLVALRGAKLEPQPSR